MQFNLHTVTDLCWPFDGDPYFNINGGDYKRQEKVDPFPCYAHPESLVRNWCDILNDAMPCAGQTDVYLPAYEGPGRTNGWESQQAYYNDKGKFGATIVLNGKRIPLHPAMTRYLITHEYGHVVEDYVQHTTGITNLRYAYCQDLRIHKSTASYYGGRTWHHAPGEVFANDFRILVAKAESEFWPHEGLAQPWAVPQVKEFWLKAQVNWSNALDMLSSATYKKN